MYVNIGGDLQKFSENSLLERSYKLENDEKV